MQPNKYHVATIAVLSAIALFQIIDCISFSYPSIVTTEYWYIFCIQQDRFEKGVFLVCAASAVFQYNLTTEQYTLIAGNYSSDGYQEGEGSDARFNWVTDLVQMDQDSLIVSDFWNSCVRWINYSSTSTLAGVCESLGFQDGPAMQARFSGPNKLILVGALLYLSDYWNNAIRILNLLTKTVTTVIHGDFNATNLMSPKYLSCIYPECENIYITFDHGVTLFNSTINTTQLIAGGLSTGTSTGFIEWTEFFQPEGLLFLTRNILIVADQQNNRMVQLNLNQDHSEVVALRELHSPENLLCYNNTLYIGTRQGIFKSKMAELPDGFICLQPETQTTTQATISTTSWDNTPTTTPTAASLTDQTTVNTTTMILTTPTVKITLYTTITTPDQHYTTIVTVISAVAGGVIVVMTVVIVLFKRKLQRTSTTTEEQPTPSQDQGEDGYSLYSLYNTINEEELDVHVAPGDGYDYPTLREAVPQDVGAQATGADDAEPTHAAPEDGYDYPTLREATPHAASPQSSDPKFANREYVEILPAKDIEDFDPQQSTDPQDNALQTTAPQAVNSRSAKPQESYPTFAGREYVEILPAENIASEPQQSDNLQTAAHTPDPYQAVDEV